MFGQTNQPDDQIPDHSIEGALQSDEVAAVPTPPTNDQNNWGHPGVPLDAGQTVTPNDPLASPDPASGDDSASQAAPQDDQPATVTNDLIDIKQKALNQLSPLVGHLDQSPEEKFRTTMMMIQASDNQALVPVAYEAANAIQDEKAKAQALLDIVNEINYFTQHHQG